MKNLGKKKLILIISIALILVIAMAVGITLAVIPNKVHLSATTTNTFSLEKIDDYSPDRKILIYADNQPISAEDISEIQLKDGTVLCRGEPFVANIFELENEDTLKIITQSNETFILTKK